MLNRIDHVNRCLRVPSGVLNELRELMDPANARKIQAIKLLRNETRCGLKEAKNAVERKFPGAHAYGSSSEAYDIRPLMAIKSITVDFGEGDVNLDLEGLQMMTLVNMTQIGLSEVRRILDLHELIKGWEESDGNGITTSDSADGGD
jgi:hypothetical protein